MSERQIKIEIPSDLGLTCEQKEALSERFKNLVADVISGAQAEARITGTQGGEHVKAEYKDKTIPETVVTLPNPKTEVKTFP